MQPENRASVTLLSVNRGVPRDLRIGAEARVTGAFKSPVDGACRLSSAGLADDFIQDQDHHGGADQAVYLYSAEDNAWWSRELGRPIDPGFFGENLTLGRWWPQPRIGDRLRLGGVLLELSFPRIPCATLAARVGAPTFLKAFVAAKRPGIYARVLQAGDVHAGLQGSVELAPESAPTAASLFELWHHGPRDVALLESALAAPLAERARKAIRGWLDAAV